MIKYITLLLIPCLLYSVDTREIKRDLEKPSIQRPSKSFPKHWGTPPEVQVRDMVKLPGDLEKEVQHLRNGLKRISKTIKKIQLNTKNPKQKNLQ